MATENHLFDDFARMATGAFGTLTGMRQEFETRLRDHLERILGRMNLVRREEFDAVQAMAAKARAAQEALETRVAVLEARLAAPAATATRPVQRRPLRPRAAVRKPKPVQPL